MRQLSQEAVEKNLVYRAVEALRRELKIRPGVEITLQKKIPAGRGLGGGSSDAAAALLGYLRFTRRKIDPARLLEIAAGLGADVPFFLFGGRALGVGKGDEIYPLPDLPKLHAADCFAEANSCADAGCLPLAACARIGFVDKIAATHKLFKFCALCWSAQEASLSNDFEAAVFRRHPRLGQIKRALLREGRQKPCWLVAVRRCLEFSRAQQRRAEPLSGFRTIRPLSARQSRGAGMRVR